jgi:hypothetical protein
MRLLDDEQFRQESSQGRFSNEIAERMLGVSLALVEAEQASHARRKAPGRSLISGIEPDHRFP